MAERIPSEVRDARRNVAKLVTERNKLLAEANQRGLVDHSRIAEIDQRIGGLFDGIVSLIDPCDASEVDPLVLLPVRLETRFGTSGRSTTLRVRIYPDEIHVDDLVRGLTDEETAAAQAYWTSVWSDPIADGAWSGFVASVGSDRAEWVAYACTPTNLVARGSNSTPAFPKVDARGVRNVTVRSLPDRFVVIAVSGNKVSQAVGRPIPRDLSLSPIPLEGDSPTRVADALTVAPGSEWLVDYDSAVAVGMAVTLTLTSGNAPLDRVVAIGTKASLGSAASADEFEQLLIGHRFGAGLGWVAQGAPTNNADRTRSPFNPRRTPEPPRMDPPKPRAGSDAVLASDLLGVDRSLVDTLMGAGTGEQDVAKQMNTALWAPGWGDYLSRLDAKGVPGVVDAQRESARELFRDHVRGRGPSPALHVGAQPYGILPVSDLRAWVPQRGETTAGIVTVIRTVLDKWLSAALAKVPILRSGNANLDDTLLAVMGSSPVMQGLRARPLVSDEISEAALASLGIDRREYDAERICTRAVMASVLGEDSTKAIIGSLHKGTRPVALPLASERDAEVIAALLETPKRVPTLDSVLQALLVLALDSADIDVAKSAPATVLPALVDFATLDDPIRVSAAALVARADSASPDELRGLATQMVSAGVSVGGQSMLRNFQPIPQVQTSLAEVALTAPATAEARLVASAALGGWLIAKGYANEVREAMIALKTTDVAARSLAVAEALDCSSHRLDAWATAVVDERCGRRISRAIAQSGSARGLTIGAYGVVENLAPRPATDVDGWIHAPSVRHATAAGMLRSAHLSHLPTSGPATAGGAFAIDLSSSRMQKAAHVLDGVRQGQQLGALVGYQIERDLGLSTPSLARFQRSLRMLAPLVARRLHDSDAGDSEKAQEAIAANNVVDGVLLLNRYTPGDPKLRDALNVTPANDYLDPGTWKPLTPKEWERVTEILREAADTVDAVADVLLSEAVVQFAGGNEHRAAAAMDAMSIGASPADTLDVLETQDVAERLTHRVLAIVAGGTPSTWNTMRPRARVEPRLEAWAAAHLGDPGDIVVADVGTQLVTLADADIAALDIVFATDLNALERNLRATVAILGDTKLAVARDPAWPKGKRSLGQAMSLAVTLRSLIAGSHVLMPADLAPPSVAPTRDLAASFPELFTRVSELAGSFASTVVSLAPKLVAIPADAVVTSLDEVSKLSAAVEILDGFGVPLTPSVERPLDVTWVRSAFQMAEARALGAQDAVKRLTELPADTPPSLVLDAVQEVVGAVFGDGFVVAPLLAPAAGPDAFVDAFAAPLFDAPAQSAIRRLVRDLATVRNQERRLSEALLLEGALGASRTLDVVQLAVPDGDGPAPGTTHWLAGPLPENGPWPRSPVAHLIVDRVGTIDADAAVGGLVIDAWVEDVPGQVGPNADPNDPRPARARTGLAIRANSASARPPQAILVAVSPNAQRWTTDALRGVVEQTLDLARIRMVTLEWLMGEGLVLPVLYTHSASLQGERYVDFAKLVHSSSPYFAMPFVKDSV